MLTYQEALEKVLEHARPLKPKLLPLRDCLGLTAAKDFVSSEPFPAFDNSAVDGYAVSMTGLNGEEPPLSFRLKGEIPAGKFSRKVLRAGEAVRIFTGAPVPKGTQAVVMQEDTEEKDRDGSLQVQREPSLVVLKRPRFGENIRFRGEDFQRGRILVRKNEVLNPAQLALLAAVGFEKIKVFPAPLVSLLVTGNELLRPGERLKPGKIRDSNSVLLEALVKKTGGIPHLFPAVRDDASEIRRWVRKGLQGDVFVISGGVSVGKYDLVRKVLKEEGVREIFWKVDIKPGKPLFFGRKGRTLVFGLPGNPVSVFVTFTEFVKPAILKMQGKSYEEVGWIQGQLTRSFQNGRRFHFVRVRVRPKKKGFAVTVLEGQGSHQLGTLALSNALLRVEPNRGLKRDERVRVGVIS